MNRNVIRVSTLAIILTIASILPAARAEDDAVQTVIILIGDKDKDVPRDRAGAGPRRSERRGGDAALRGASAEACAGPQVGLLGALVGRGDAAAKPAVLDLLKDSQGEVRSAAIRHSARWATPATCRGWSIAGRRNEPD